MITHNPATMTVESVSLYPRLNDLIQNDDWHFRIASDECGRIMRVDGFCLCRDHWVDSILVYDKFSARGLRVDRDHAGIVLWETKGRLDTVVGWLLSLRVRD